MTPRTVTEADLRMIQYFHEEKGNIRRYASWPEIEADFTKKYPHVIDAMERLRSAELTLNILIERLVD